jgi:4-hydroxy-3-methylbut-2-enyl diphosphate reductase
VSGMLVAAPLRVEQLLIRSAAPRANVRITGMGTEKSKAAARALREEPGDSLMVLGFCGGLDEHSRPGEVVVAEEVLAATDEGHTPERVPCAGFESLASALAAAGLRVRTGSIVSVSRLALGGRRAELLAAGAIAVDMESAWLASGAGGRAFGVVRVVLDSPSHELLRPQAVLGAARAAQALRRAAARTLHDWAPEG